MKQMKGTKNCVRCLKRKAKIWGGHVKKDKEDVLAGWCNKCREISGFSGHYLREMGMVVV